MQLAERESKGTIKGEFTKLDPRLSQDIQTLMLPYRMLKLDSVNIQDQHPAGTGSIFSRYIVGLNSSYPSYVAQPDRRPGKGIDLDHRQARPSSQLPHWQTPRSCATVCCPV